MATSAEGAVVAESGDGGPVAAPPLKWAGGKRQLLPEIRKHVPETFGRYFEPFLGGGAVFFDLHASGRIRSDAYLGDVNADLVTVYRIVRSDTDRLVAALRAHARKHSTEHYYAVRGQKVVSGTLTAAARTIYLNRTCFNGLYRVNRKGEFNVPIGKYTNPTVCDEPNLRACARALEVAGVANEDFASVVVVARAGDFVYFDPPYLPVSETGNFTAFTAAGFGMHDQERLAACARRLKEGGVRVLLSNADLPAVRKIYDGFELRRVTARRNINSKGGGRGDVGELLIW